MLSAFVDRMPRDMATPRRALEAKVRDGDIVGCSELAHLTTAPDRAQEFRVCTFIATCSHKIHPVVHESSHHFLTRHRAPFYVVTATATIARQQPNPNKTKTFAGLVFLCNTSTTTDAPPCLPPEHLTAGTMWRRVYFLLVLVRIYFALSPSYLHPDENFQGPEVIAGLFTRRFVTVRQQLTASRTRLFLSRPRNMGVHVGPPHPQHISTMARIRLAHVHPALALGGVRI